MKFNYAERAVALSFKRIGVVISKNPIFFIVAPILLTCLLSSGILWLKIVDDPEYLFTPSNGRGKHERRRVEALFPMNYSYEFDVSRSPRVEKFGRLIIVAKDNGSILRDDIFNQVLEVNSYIKDIKLEKDGLEWKFSHLCAKSNGECFENDVLVLAKHMKAIEKGNYKIKYPLYIDMSSYKPYFYGMFLGGITLDDQSNIKSAKAVALIYFLDSTSADLEKLTSQWERAFVKGLGEKEFANISVFRLASHTMGAEIEASAKRVTPYISLTILLMFIFSIISSMTGDCTTSKPLLGLMGCISANLAVGAAYGACLLAGFDFITSNLGVAFIMLGIGMDDTFVLLAAWRRTDPYNSVEERMSETFKHAGVSITITSLTNFFSFTVGTLTPFPLMQIFCSYAAVAVLFTYIYQVSFFGGCLALTGRAEKKNLHSITFRPAIPKEYGKNRSILFRLLCTGGIIQNESGVKQKIPDHYLMKFFRDKVGGFISRPIVKGFVLFFFVIYLGFAIFGIFRLEEGLNISDLYSYDSYARSYVNIRNEYFNTYKFRVQVVVNHTFDYSKPEDQKEVEEMLMKFEATPFIAPRDLSESWLRAYLMFLKEPKTFFLRRSYNTSTKEGFYKCLHKVFLNLPPVKRFANDVIFNENKTEIIASRYIIQSYNWSSSNDVKSMVQTLRGQADLFPYDVTVFNNYFIYIDQYVLIRDCTIQAVLTTAVLMNIITFIFIPKLSCALWVGFSIISIQLGLIGYTSLWGKSLNSITMMAFIMCLGFSVDNAAHVSYAYMSIKKPNPNDRIKEALFWVGLPVIQGSSSTILGIIVLAFAPAYVYKVIFKSIFLVMLFSALHSIFLLPTLLSIFDSLFSSKKDNDIKEKINNNGMLDLEKETMLLPAKLENQKDVYT